MSATLPVPISSSCCPPSAPIVNIPGTPGDDGDDGAAGAAGQSAFTTLSTGFTMPTYEATGAAIVGNSDWLAVNALVQINGSTLKVTAIADATHITLQNLETADGLAYSGNAAPTTVFGAGTKLVAGGPQGPSGALTGTAGGDLAGTFPNPTLGITTTKGDIIARTATINTRLAIGADGTRAKADSSQTAGLLYAKVDLAATTEITGIAAISNGGTGQATKAPAYDALNPNTTRGDLTKRGASANERLAIGAANTVLKSDANDPSWTKVTSDMMDASAKYHGRYGILGSLTAVNLNSVADNAITINSARYVVRKIIVESPSAAIAAAQAGVFTSTGGGGTAVVASATALTLSATNRFLDVTLASPGGLLEVRTETPLYFRVTTAEGTALTANVWVFGEDLSA